MTIPSMGAMLLLLAAFGLLLMSAGGVTIWWLVRDDRWSSEDDEALEALGERDVEGETDPEELESRRRDLAA